MTHDPAHRDRNAVSPGDTNASRIQHEDGRGSGGTGNVPKAPRGESDGRDVPPADDRKGKRSPDSPWMGGG